MADQLQLRGGTTSEHATFTGALREVTVDTDKDTVVVHDNATVGGKPLLREDLSNLPAGTIDNADINASAAIAGTKISPDFGSQTIATTGVFSHALGAAATPSITFTGDTNTGVYSPGADQVAVATNGTQRLTVDTAATTSTLPVVHPLGAVGTPSLTFTGDLNTGIWSPAADTIAFSEGGVEAMRIDSSGRVGIGTSSPGAALDITNSLEPLSVKATTASRNYITHKHNSSGDIAYLGAGGAALSAGTATDYAIRANQGALLFATNGDNERARIDSSGRLLVGTTTSTSTANTGSNQNIQVQGTSNYANISVIANVVSGSGGYLTLAKSRSTAPGGFTVVNSGDELGAISFEGADGSAFKTGAYISAAVDGTPGANDMPGRLVFSTTADGASLPTERMRIAQDGRINMFAASGSSLEVANSNAAGTTNYIMIGRHSSITINGGTTAYVVYTNGNVQNTNGSYTTLSDAKLKENIVDASSQWDDLKSIQIRNWNFKSETGHETHRQIGPIAQELEQVCPGLVFETLDRDEDGNETGEVTKGVNQSVLYMKAVKALQEAMERIEQLEAKVAALEPPAAPVAPAPVDEPAAEQE